MALDHPERAMRPLAALICSAFLLGGCAGLQRLADGSLDSPQLTLVQASVAEADSEGATVRLDLTLENPNDLAFEVASARWRLEVEGTELGKGALPGGLAIPARDVVPFGVTVRVRWAEVRRLVERVGKKEQVAYRISGSVGVKTPVGLVALAFDHAGKLPVPRLPTLRLAGAAVELASFTELDLELALEVENPNPFPLPGAALTFELLVNGTSVAAGREATLAPLAAHGMARVALPLRLSLLGAGRAAASIHGGEVRLRGFIRAAGIEAPIDLRLELGR
jgi:LEA14-like dessication related protein